MDAADILPCRARNRGAKRKERAASWSILASTAITLAKGAAGLATGSLALISDAAHSLLDVAATTITWLAVRAAAQAGRRASTNYGHGKFESLAALVETAFLFLLSGAVAYEGVRRLSTAAKRASRRAGPPPACSSAPSSSMPGAGGR